MLHCSVDALRHHPNDWVCACAWTPDKWGSCYAADKIVWQAARCRAARLTDSVTSGIGVLSTRDMASSDTSLSLARSTWPPVPAAPTRGPAIDLQLTSFPVGYCCYS